MSLSVEDYVNERPGSAALGYLPDYVVAVQDQSPVDEFKTTLKDSLMFGLPELLNSNDMIGRLLLIALVSAVENYVRSIISGAITLCPLAQACASDRSVNLGAVIWHSGSRYSRTLLEHSSLADGKGLTKAFKDFTDVALPPAEFSGLLDEFEKICQLRHGIVHADGFLPAKNALRLEIPRQVTAARIIVRYRQLQEIAGVLDALVGLLNRHMFSNLCRRWALDWRRRADWNPSVEDRLFRRIWNLCYSRIEAHQRVGRSKISRGACWALVKAQYDLT